MHSVAEAQALILQHARPLPPESMPLTQGLGRILAEEVASDLDMPPFDKALMDGYAVRSADLADGRATLAVVEEITAGRTPTRPLAPGQAARIMTGAPIPAGADAVVIVERSRPLDDGHVLLEDRPPRPGQNILYQGREMRRGEVVLRAGTAVRPQEIGLLATVGRAEVRVHPAPALAVLSTGDEVVEAPQAPGPGQIRNGNGPMLVAQAARAGAVPHYLGIARDRPAELKARIAEGLRMPVLILSGGVSAGKLDLVPGVLRELGVTAHVDKVAMKPGKPVFFGTHPGGLVFGLPGNPVSSLVCFELFVRPALRRLQGLPDPGPRYVQATLVEDFPYRTDRPTYHPARLERKEEGGRRKEEQEVSPDSSFLLPPSSFVVRPVPWFGSADLRGLVAANAFVVLPAGDHEHRRGQGFAVLCTDE